MYVCTVLFVQYCLYSTVCTVLFVQYCLYSSVCTVLFVQFCLFSTVWVHRMAIKNKDYPFIDDVMRISNIKMTVRVQSK